MEYYIYITNDCNLNCSYCSVMLDNKNTSTPLNIRYDLKDLKKFIDFTQKENKDDSATICFFGGEPTLDYGCIENIINEFKNIKAYEISFILHTNGLLLNALPDKIIEKTDVIFLSLNYEKIYEKGQISDYYINTLNSINKIKRKKQIPVIGRLTITKETSLFTQCALMGNIFDYVYWQMDNQKYTENIEEYKIQYKKDISLLFDYWLSYLRQGVILYYVPFLGIIKNYIDNVPPPENYYCGYGYYSVFVQTDGACYACCEAVESCNHKIGDIYNGVKFNGMSLKGTMCPSCAYVKVCGGRCGRMHKDYDNKRIKDFCELNIFTFNLIKNSLPEIKKIMQTNSDFFQAVYDYHLDYTELMP